MESPSLISKYKSYNQLILDTLRTYIMGASADFPVLVTGPWGCGKTYLIKVLIDQIKNEGGAVLYVSLNGVASVAEIEQRIVEAFCGDVSRAWMFKVLRVGNGIASLVKNMGIDVTAILSGASDSFTKYEQAKTLKCAVVFDDIERCELPMRQWMGYLERFSEQVGKPAIYICNEEKLFLDSAYKTLKEKFVGMTYRLSNEPNIVLPELMKAVAYAFREQERVQAFGVFLMNEVLQKAGHFNYRAFKSALWQLKYCLRQIGDDVFQPDYLEFHFACIFLALAYPNQLGILEEDVSIKTSSEDKSEKAERFTWADSFSICTQFDSNVFGMGFSFNQLIRTDSWRATISNGEIYGEALHDELQNSTYHHRSDYVWEPLFRAWAKDDGQTRKARRNVLFVLRAHKFTNSAEIRLVFELLRKYDKRRYDALSLIKSKRLKHFLPTWEDCLQHLTKRFEDYVSQVKEQLVFSEDGTWNDSFAGFSISEEKDDWYQHNLAFIETLAHEQDEKKIREQITACLNEENLTGLCQFLMTVEVRNRPVVLLDDVACARFAFMLLNAPVKDQFIFQEMIRERYYERHPDWQEELSRLIQEADSWKTILEKMEQNRDGVYCRRGQWKQPNRIASVEETIDLIQTSLVHRFNIILSSRKTDAEPNEMANTTEEGKV